MLKSKVLMTYLMLVLVQVIVLIKLKKNLIKKTTTLKSISPDCFKKVQLNTLNLFSPAFLSQNHGNIGSVKIIFLLDVVDFKALCKK